MDGSTENGASSDAYGLTRDAVESKRLNAQHNVWRTNLGYLLHPRIQSDLAEDRCIGDVGTGTGVCIVDLASELAVNGKAARIKVVQSMPGVSIHAARQLSEQIVHHGRKSGQGWDDVQNLASTMSSAGFENVCVDVFASDRVASTREDFNDSIIGALAGMIKMFVKAQGQDSFWTGEGKKLHADAAEELADGKAYYRAEINVVYARKAIS